MEKHWWCCEKKRLEANETTVFRYCKGKHVGQNWGWFPKSLGSLVIGKWVWVWYTTRFGGCWHRKPLTWKVGEPSSGIHGKKVSIAKMLSLLLASGKNKTVSGAEMPSNSSRSGLLVLFSHCWALPHRNLSDASLMVPGPRGSQLDSKVSC